MDVKARLIADVHGAVNGAKSPDSDDVNSETAIVRAFVRLYAEHLNVVAPEEGDGCYCEEIGQWLSSNDVTRERACVESARLIAPLGNWGNDYWRWVWEDGRLCVRNPGTSKMSILHVNAWWRIQERKKRKRHPLGPIVEAWVRSVSDGPPLEEWYLRRGSGSLSANIVVTLGTLGISEGGGGE